MNGQLYTSEEAHQYGQSLDWLALALTNQETQVLAEAVYYRKVTDDDDVTVRERASTRGAAAALAASGGSAVRGGSRH